MTDSDPDHPKGRHPELTTMMNFGTLQYVDIRYSKQMELERDISNICNYW